MASADKELIDFIKKDVSIWNINSFAEFYMQIYDKYSGDYNLACKKFIAERNRFLHELTAIPWLKVVPSQANYFLCKVNAPHTSGELTRRLLLEHDILIKDCNSKNALKERNYIRIAIRDQRDNDCLVKALKEL